LSGAAIGQTTCSNANVIAEEPMSEKKVGIQKSKGIPDIEVLIGGANLGSYVVQLWNDSKGSWTTVREGANNDPVQDKFPLPGPMAALDQTLLRWTIVIDSLTGKDGDRYQAVVSLSQRGVVVPNGLFPYEDAFQTKNGQPLQQVISQTVLLEVV
jgi:hypothetical protein